jgi:hypothetical protein
MAGTTTSLSNVEPSLLHGNRQRREHRGPWLHDQKRRSEPVDGMSAAPQFVSQTHLPARIHRASITKIGRSFGGYPDITTEEKSGDGERYVLRAT